jgi:predicted DNA-binding transcriptional regulator AlpA
MDELLTPAEVAARLRRPVATVRYWRATRTGPKSARVGGRILFRQSDVESWIEEQFSAEDSTSLDAEPNGAPAA